LKCILSVVRIAKDAAANTEDHRPVPYQECLEGPTIAAADKLIEQLGVGEPGDRPI
jgi:hypothetical protein